MGQYVYDRPYILKMCRPVSFMNVCPFPFHLFPSIPLCPLFLISLCKHFFCLSLSNLMTDIDCVVWLVGIGVALQRLNLISNRVLSPLFQPRFQAIFMILLPLRIPDPCVDFQSLRHFVTLILLFAV